jgi:hypothetical protein
MTLSPGPRKLALALHLTVSVGWFGAATGFLALAVPAATSSDTQVIRSACLGMLLMVSYVIVPLACASLLTGLLSALGSPWGLFRHYWVLVKLLLATVALTVLLVQVEPIRELARVAADPSLFPLALHGLRGPLIHAVGGLVVLLAVQLLGVFKPRGLTPYGKRNHPTPPTTGTQL